MGCVSLRNERKRPFRCQFWRMADLVVVWICAYGVHTNVIYLSLSLSVFSLTLYFIQSNQNGFDYSYSMFRFAIFYRQNRLCLFYFSLFPGAKALMLEFPYRKKYRTQREQHRAATLQLKLCSKANSNEVRMYVWHTNVTIESSVRQSCSQQRTTCICVCTHRELV